MLGPDRAEFRANDDGEPSSTAGKPILGQINSAELTDILIVVVRYYGGVNLGTGRFNCKINTFHYLCGNSENLESLVIGRTY
jgi:putative IMPACT (imprinted ancient) family translation regulator